MAHSNDWMYEAEEELKSLSKNLASAFSNSDGTSISSPAISVEIFLSFVARSKSGSICNFRKIVLSNAFVVNVMSNNIDAGINCS